MTQFQKTIISTMLILTGFATSALAADTAIGNLNISGSVPTVFSITTRGIPGDLDLTPGVIVNQRLIGLMHFKFNVDAASITIASSTVSGQPEDASANAYSFSSAFKVSVKGTCTTLNLAALGLPAGVALTNAGTDYKSTIAASLITNVPVGGIEEDCQLTATWGGTTANLPLAGVYSMSIVITMVSI